MNPLTNMKNVKKLSEQELKGSNKTSWHDQYKDSAWIFIGGLPYDLTEGDVVCVFSQYGEIVNINLVRDKDTGKSKGFCFICYEDQRSTILAVDNLNGIKLLKRTIRVDHVADYKVPKESKKIDEETRQLQKEGCAPGSEIIKKLSCQNNSDVSMNNDDIKLPERLPIGPVKVKSEKEIKKLKKDKKKTKKLKKRAKKLKKKLKKLKKKKDSKESSSSSNSSDSSRSDSDSSSSESDDEKDKNEKEKEDVVIKVEKEDKVDNSQKNVKDVMKTDKDEERRDGSYKNYRSDTSDNRRNDTKYSRRDYNDDYRNDKDYNRKDVDVRNKYNYKDDSSRNVRYDRDRREDNKDRNRYSNYRSQGSSGYDDRYRKHEKDKFEKRKYEDQKKYDDRDQKRSKI